VTGAHEYPADLARLTRYSGAPPRSMPYGPAADQLAQLWLPSGPGPHPVVALLHGGYWRERYRLDVMHALAADLRAHDVAVWNLEYRRVGGEGGWPATFEDVAAGFDAIGDHARRERLDAGRVAVVGHSAGGHLALWVASRAGLAAGPGHAPRLRPAMAVALAGVCDLREAARLRLSGGAALDLLGGAPDQVPDRYALGCPTSRLPLGVPQLLYHGTADDSVPLDISRRYRAAAAGAGDACELVELPGVDHFALIDPASAAWAAIRSRLLADLASQGAASHR
jgi:acetyl esterase/lipase